MTEIVKKITVGSSKFFLDKRFSSQSPPSVMFFASDELESAIEDPKRVALNVMPTILLHCLVISGHTLVVGQ